MRKQVKSFWSKRILAILLSMLVLATAVPIGTFLALALDYGEVTVLTLADEAVVNEDDPTQVTVAYAPESTVTLEKDGQNGWQAQLRITAPASMEATLSAAVYQEKFGTGEWQEDAETLPFQADPVAEANTSLVLSASMDAELLQSNETLCYAWRFDWDGDTVYDQTVTYTIDASRVVLMEGGEQIYPVYGTVQAITNADAASVTADSTMPAVDKTTISYAERLELSQTAEGTPWLVQIRVTAPLGFDAEKLASAQYQSSPAGSENWSAAGSFLTNAQAGADGTYALDLNAEIASAALEEQSNVGTQWQFDWDGDGAYEQLVVLNLDPARLTLKDAGGAQVWPKAEATLTIDPADADAAGGQVTATATLDEVGEIRAIWNKNEQTLTLSIAEASGYHFTSVSVNGTVQEIPDLTDSTPATVGLSDQAFEEIATIAVGFKINTYTLAVTETGSGNVEGNVAAFTPPSAEHGTPATLTLSCAEGYRAIDVNGVFGEANGVIADGTNEAVTNSSLTTKNTITGPLTAEIRFDPVEYTISYHTPVGTAPANSIYTVETETVVLPEMANLDGFAFSGWATLDEKNTVAAEGLVESFDPTQATNIDLYAVWDVETAVSAKTGDGETVSSNSWTTASTVNLTFASELNADSLTYTYAVGETEETLAASDAITSEGSTEATYTVQQAAFTDADGVHYIYETISDSDQSTAPTFVLLQDSVAPTASMKVATANSPIEKFLTTITFGLLSFKETTEATVSVSDSVSGLSKVEYLEMEYPQAAYGEQTNTFQLDEVAASQGWQAVSGFQNGADTAEVSVEIKAKENKNIILFVRTTDVAGNVSYICSDGVIVDITPPTGVLQPQGYTSELTDDELDNKKPIYGKAQVEKTDSILINVEVTEEALQEEGASTAILQSGIATITYSTQVKNRADDEYRYIEKDESLYTHQGDIQTDIHRTITLKNVSQDYNYNYVLITLDVTDLAGNSATYTREIAVDLTAPTVTVRYDPLESASGSMYNKTRVATFTYTERTENWDKEDAEERLRNLIHAANLEHDPLEDAYTLGEWVNVAGTTPDEDTHSIEVIFNDANYTIQDKSGENYVNAEACVDKAGNITETIAAADETVENPFRFTVDTAAPYELGLDYTSETDIRDVMLNGITFGFWQNAEGADASVTATLTAHDVTSGVKQFVVTIKTDGAESATTADMPADADLNQAGRQFVIGTEPVEQDAEGAVTYTNIVADTADPTLYTATVKLPAQFRGKLSFEAVDYAANKTVYTDDDYVVVVDDIAPKIQAEYKGVQTATVASDAWKADVDKAEVAADTKYVFSSAVETTLTFTDANFDLSGEEEAKIEIFKDGQAYTGADVDWSAFMSETTQQEATLTLEENGDYQIRITYTDNSGNQQTPTGEEYLTGSEGIYTTNIITVDTTAPEVNVTFDETEAAGEKGGVPVYGQARTMTIEVTDRNFRPTDGLEIDGLLPERKEADFQYTVIGANGEETSAATEDALYEAITKEENWKNVTPEGEFNETWQLQIKFAGDAAYPAFRVNAKDLAGYTAGAEVPAFVVDKTAPYELGLAYTSETDIRDVVLNGITFGFWQNAEGADASVTATLTAHDVTSGVKQFVVTIKTDGAESATTADMPADADLNQAGRQFVIGTEPVEQDAEGAVTYTNIVADTADPTLYTATVKLPAQFRGKLSFEAVDYAANKTEFNGDVQSSDGAYPKNDYVAVVDNTNPQLMIHYGNNGRYVDQGSLVDQIESENTIAYYQQDAKVELTFTDANFDLGGEDRTEIQVFKDGQAYTEADIVWSDFAKTTAQQTATLTLSEDGDYQISVSYVDYSGNLLEVEREEGSAYAVETAAGTFMTTNIITVDKTAPEIEEITITPNEVVSALEGRAYYDVPQTVTITVREHNFCIGRILNAAAFADFIIPGEDAQSELVAANVSSERLSEIEQDLIDQIRDEENWTSDGDLHTVTLQFQSDANYTINFKPIDLAGNVLVNEQLQTFTVDVTDPEILGIDYEQQVFGTIISGLTFGYYNAQVEATVTAEDDTAGVYRFEYEGLLADGVSEKNQAVLQTAIQEADITQLSDAAGNATNRFEASFRIPREVLTELNSFNGTVTVTAYDRSENTMTFADDERLVVDRIAPTCLVTFNQEVETVNNVSYYDVPVTATVQINEANFYAEDVNILVNSSRVEPSDWTQNGDVWTATVTMAQEGDYVFSVEYTDRSGNQMQTYTSNQKTVDLTAPSIRVQNVRHESANNAETVGFTLVVTDRNLGADRIAPSLQVVTRSGDIGNYAFSTQTIPLGAPAVSTDANGNTVYTYTVANLDADGYYTIVCSVRDYAGHEVQNIGAETAGGTTETDAVHFSVNREGSVFWIETEHTDKYASGDDRIKYNALQDAYANDVVTVALHEVNVDRVDAFDAEEMQTVLTLNDGSQSEDITLVEGDNYQKNTSVGAGGWYESVYTLDNENFDHDGYYSMSIITYDMAGNSNVNQSQESGVLRFTLDRTNPIISTNVEQENAIINADAFPVEIRLTEANVEEISVLLNDGEVTAEDLGDNTYQVVVDAGSAQTLQVYAKDKAGNESTYDIVDLTVSTNPFVRFYANKPLFWGSVAGVVVLTGFVLFLVLWKRRKKEEQE